MCYESRTFRWIQIIPAERQDLIDRKELDPRLAHHHWTCSDDTWEFHVNDCRKFSEKIKEKIRGCLTVRYPFQFRLVIAIGKDESAFKQCQFAKIL